MKYDAGEVARFTAKAREMFHRQYSDNPPTEAEWAEFHLWQRNLALKGQMAVSRSPVVTSGCSWLFVVAVGFLWLMA